MHRPIVPASLRGVYDQWHFAPAVVANGFVFCSGIIGTSPGGETPGADGLAGAQATLSDADAPLAALMAVKRSRSPVRHRLRGAEGDPGGGRLHPRPTWSRSPPTTSTSPATCRPS
jgi:hypothetical protein